MNRQQFIIKQQRRTVIETSIKKKFTDALSDNVPEECNPNLRGVYTVLIQRTSEDIMDNVSKKVSKNIRRNVYAGILGELRQSGLDSIRDNSWKDVFEKRTEVTIEEVTIEEVKECIECCVCQTEVNENIVEFGCKGKHKYCGGCISEWILRHPTCPLCRWNIDWTKIDTESLKCIAF